MNAIRNWLATAPPEAKLGYLIAAREHQGYHVDDDTIAQLAFVAGVTTSPPITILRITIQSPKPAFDPNAQCAFPECTNPIGEYRGGRKPIMCPDHRHRNRYDRNWSRRDTDA